jgi:hypothetical protein
MLTHCKLVGLFTHYQVDTLKKLAELSANSNPLFYRPRDVGASRNSHHTKTLSQLQAQGLVERIELSSGNFRPAYGYRISSAGVSTFNLFKALADVPLDLVPGHARDRRRAAFAKGFASLA